MTQSLISDDRKNKETRERWPRARQLTRLSPGAGTRHARKLTHLSPGAGIRKTLILQESGAMFGPRARQLTHLSPGAEVPGPKA